MKELILYTSRAGENYHRSGKTILEIGNTEVVAKKLQEMNGANIFKIEPKIPYPEEYQETTEIVKYEQNNNIKPEIISLPDNFNDYELITLMYPIWWGTMPMYMFTALESLDFNGKVIRPIATHEGSGMGRSESDIKRICNAKKIEKGLAIKGSESDICDNILEKWLSTFEY